MAGRLLRIIALLSAVATAVMPGLLAVAEGLVEATAAATVTAHIEAAGGSDSCPVAHDAHCAACTMLRHGYTGPEATPVVAADARCAAGAPAWLAAAAPGQLHGSQSARAPPAA